jgi:hypothetical protein
MGRLLVTGSRDWDEPKVIEQALLKAWRRFISDGRTVLVSGHCPTGADWIAEQVAGHFNWEIELHPADWHRYGKAAGFRRNAEMIDLGADLVLAFIRNDSHGATNTLDLAIASKMPTIVWRVNENG